MSIQFYLQTRGKTIDYRFLYDSPPSESSLSGWWRFYEEYTLFEDKTIILQRLGGEKGRLYLSGIPSIRRDRVNTVIRYTLVAEFDQDEDCKILSLVETFLGDCRKGSNILGNKLDDCFLEKDIEDALRYAKRDHQKHQDEINQKIASLFQLFSSPASDDKLRNNAWWGRLKSEKSCKNSLSLANQILNGEPGVVALLNATSEKSLSLLKERLRKEDIENIFILLPDDDTPPTSIKDISKPIEDFQRRGGNFLGGLIDFQRFQPQIYIGASVLVSVFLFLVFMLAR